jgi:hypothetical protein
MENAKGIQEEQGLVQDKNGTNDAFTPDHHKTENVVSEV